MEIRKVHGKHENVGSMFVDADENGGNQLKILIFTGNEQGNSRTIQQPSGLTKMVTADNKALQEAATSANFMAHTPSMAQNIDKDDAIRMSSMPFEGREMSSGSGAKVKQHSVINTGTYATKHVSNQKIYSRKQTENESFSISNQNIKIDQNLYGNCL